MSNQSTEPIENKPYQMNVVTALNSRYMRYAYVMLTSLFCNQPDACIHVYLLHSSLTDADQKTLLHLTENTSHTITFIKIDTESFSASLPTTQIWPLEAYYRLKLLDVIPE